VNQGASTPDGREAAARLRDATVLPATEGEHNVVRADNLAGKVALITGGANGIGAAVAGRLAAGGATVVVADIDETAGKAVADETGGTFLHGDVTSLEDNQKVVNETVDRHGGLDLVHLNAGIATGFGLEEGFDVERYRRAMAINLDGVVYGVHAALPALRARHGGTIVVTASMAGLVPVPFDPLYAANKHAVVGLARSLGQLYANDGIKVQALCPSFADTAILGDARSFLERAGFPILDVADVVEAFMGLLDSEGTGECWFVVPGRRSEPFQFRNAPGPRTSS
jgi:NAD(P)-dependent dehydrogenase (short-subunit alcohol dehydrogenase family)